MDIFRAFPLAFVGHSTILVVQCSIEGRLDSGSDSGAFSGRERSLKALEMSLRAQRGVCGLSRSSLMWGQGRTSSTDGKREAVSVERRVLL